MPAVAHFQNLPTVIFEYLADARQHIFIAMCWFSHGEIFDLILEKLRAGVRVDLVLEYDAQNIRKGGLPFHKFIQFGGNLYAHLDTALMHHKFALIDDQTLLTGSFNWTYSSHAENLLVITDRALITTYREEFHRLKALCIPVRKIRLAEAKPLVDADFFQNTAFQLTDLRRKISSGARLWWVRVDRLRANGIEHFRAHRLPFDPEGLLRPYWAAYQVWCSAWFDTYWKLACQNTGSSVVMKRTRRIARQLQIGDVVLALTGRQMAIALGVVQSEPKAAIEGDAWSSYRKVEWLRVFASTPFNLPKPVSPDQIGRFQGSNLALLQAVWEAQGINLPAVEPPLSAAAPPPSRSHTPPPAAKTETPG